MLPDPRPPSPSQRLAGTLPTIAILIPCLVLLAALIKYLAQ